MLKVISWNAHLGNKVSILTVQIEYTEETRSNTNESIPLTLSPSFNPFPYNYVLIGGKRSLHTEQKMTRAT